MRIFKGLTGLAVLLVPFALHAAECPLSAVGETPEDCPWAGIARDLTATATDPGASPDQLIRTLGKESPVLMAQLKADASRERIKDAWGESINFDELAKGIVVDPVILRALASELRLAPPRDRIVHAGMEHTYGYLFSLLKTPFGYKRARWVRDDIEAGFALPRGSLGPTPTQGTLLGNVTYFAGSIAFRTEPKVRAGLAKEGPRVPEALRKFPFDELKTVRLVETVKTPEGKEVEIRTDLVPFLKTLPGKSNTHLLIYSIVEGSGRPKLITAFPVEKSFVDKVIDPSALGEGKTVISRYNAFVEGVTAANPALTGTRKLQ